MKHSFKKPVRQHLPASVQEPEDVNSFHCHPFDADGGVRFLLLLAVDHYQLLGLADVKLKVVRVSNVLKSCC